MEPKTYRVETRGGGDCDNTPSVAIFSIDELTAKTIMALAALVTTYGLHRVEKFDYRTQYLQFDPETIPEDAEAAGEENEVRTDCDSLVVHASTFKFSAYIKHTDVQVWTDEQSIDELVAHFGLSEPTPEPVKIVIDLDGGVVNNVLTSVPASYIVYDSDTDGCSDDEIAARPWTGEDETIEVHKGGCYAAEVNAAFLEAAFNHVLNEE